MRFQVPQFIEVEDKIVGPLTIKQFIYLAGGAGMVFVVYKFVPYLVFSLPIIAIIAILSLALAFYKVNNRNFIEILEAGVKFYTGSKLYVWKKQEKKVEEIINQKETNTDIFVPKLSDSKLKELTWSLDVKQNENPLTKEK
jgi:hypothetical protein